MGFNNQSIKYRSPIHQIINFNQGWSLRLLNSTYTGYCIRIRRASDNAETDIGFVGGVVDTAAISSFCSGTTGYVTKWYDQETVNFANDLIQTVAALQPKIYESGSMKAKNSKPAIYFAGGTYLVFNVGTGVTSFVPGNPFSFYAVSNNATAGDVGTIFCTSLSSNFRVSAFSSARASAPYRNFLVQNTSSTVFACDLSGIKNNTNQKLTLGFRDSSNNMSGFDDGSTGGTATMSGTYTNDTVLVGIQFSGNTPLTGHIQEIVFFTDDYSSSRSVIEKEVNSYYNIY